MPREKLWECLRLAETSECYITIIKDMYDGATTTVRRAAGLTEEFKVGVRLHQGSALSPFLFAIIMDKLTKDIKKDTPWDMLFADDIVLSRQNFRELEDDLEIWRNGLERRGLKVSWSKTEYLKAEDVDDGEELKLQLEKLKRAKNFKYLGSTVSGDGRCEEEVRRRIQAGWMSWKKVSGVLCDKKLSARVKGKMYKSVVRPAMLYRILFCFICHIYPPFTRKRIVSLYFGREVRTRLGVAFFEVYGPPVFHIKAGRPVKCLAQGHNKRTCRLVLHNLP